MFKQLKKKAIFSGWDSFLKQVFQGNILLNKKRDTPRYQNMEAFQTLLPIQTHHTYQAACQHVPAHLELWEFMGFSKKR